MARTTRACRVLPALVLASVAMIASADDTQTSMQTEPIQFQNAVLKIQSGQSIGTYSRGLCWSYNPMVWHGDSHMKRDGDDLNEVFNRESANYG